MLEPLIKAIQGAVVPEVLHNGDYWSKQVYLPPAEPEAEPIQISTLTGLVDYLKADIDAKTSDMHIEVISPTAVQICNALTGRHRQRETFLVADCRDFIGNGFPFGQWLDTEQFVIALQSQFVQTEERDQVIAIVGSIVDQNVRESSDDGMTQNVTTRAGIQRKEDTEVPNPITLKPYRTFPEIDQPESPFVLRLRRDRGIQAALFEAGGGAWKCEAVRAIATYLKGRLDDSISVLA
ncbi:MAG: hypothetical protein AAF609_18490 [Cyanobacteria bacterium P01_C01_bin.120]